MFSLDLKLCQRVNSNDLTREVFTLLLNYSARKSTLFCQTFADDKRAIFSGNDEMILWIKLSSVHLKRGFL